MKTYIKVLGLTMLMLPRNTFLDLFFQSVSDDKQRIVEMMYTVKKFIV